jgi:hypothetical protein
MSARTEKIKKHFHENKKVYIAGGVCLVIGAVSALVLKRSTTGSEIVQQVTQIGFRNEASPVIINLVERSTASKPVHLVGTNLYFSSLSEAARETGHPLSTLSKHINGFIPDVKGDVFELIEKVS